MATTAAIPFEEFVNPKNDDSGVSFEDFASGIESHNLDAPDSPEFAERLRKQAEFENKQKAETEAQIAKNNARIAYLQSPLAGSEDAHKYLKFRTELLQRGIDPDTLSQPTNPWNIAGEAIKGPGKEMAQVGRFGVGALADIGSRAEAALAGEKIPGFENVSQVVQEGMLPEQAAPLPTEKERRFLPPALRAVEAGAQGLVATAPQLALSALSPEAAPLVFGLTPEGFDPKSAAMAAALPIVGKYSGEIASNIAKKLGVSASEALNVIKATTAAGTGGAVVYGDAERQIRGLESQGKITPQQAQEMRIDAFGNAAIMAALSATGTKLEPGIRDAAKQFLEQTKTEPLPSVELSAQRPESVPAQRLGVRLAQRPQLDPLHEQVLAEQRPGFIALPGEVPAIEQLKRSGQVIPGGDAAARVERPGGGEAIGGKVSFAAPAEAEAIPSGAQAGVASEIEKPKALLPEKGVENAPQEIQQQTSGVAEHPGTSESGTPAETGGGNRPVEPTEVRASAQAPESEVPLTEKPRMLGKAEDAINKRISEIRKEGRVRSLGDPELGLLQLGKGAIKIAKGIHDFNRWSIEMIKDFGEKIRPILKPIWDEAVQIFQGNHPTLEMSENGVVKKSNAGSEIDRLSNASKEQFDAELKRSGNDLTGMAYKLGEKLKSSDIPALEAAREKWVQENRAAKELVKTPEDFNTYFQNARPTQFFEEAKRFRQAMDEAVKRGAKTKEEYAAIESKYGVGRADRGQALMDAVKRDSLRTVRLYRGQDGAGVGGQYWSDNPEYASSFGKNIQYVDVPQNVAEAARETARREGNGTPGVHILPDEYVKQAKLMENPPQPKVYDLEEPVEERGMGARLREARKQNNLGDNGGFITLPTRDELDRIVEWAYSKSPESILHVARKLDQIRKGIAWRFSNGKLVDAITYTKDSGNNAAALFANRNGNEIEQDLRRAIGDTALVKRFGGEWFKKTVAPWSDPKELAKAALTFVVESGQDRERLQDFRAQLENATPPTNRSRAELTLWEKWRQRAISAIDYADANFDKLFQVAKKYQIKTGLQLSMEGLSGIEVRHRDNYVMHAQDVEGRFDFSTSPSIGRGDNVRFKKFRTHDTYADSIAAGVIPQSLDAVKLLKARLNLGQRAMNNRAWLENLNKMTDAKTGQPLSAPFTSKIVTRPVTQFRQAGNRSIPVADQGWSIQYRDVNGVRTPVQVASEMQAPDGYERVNFAGQDIAIHEGFAPLFHALTDPSALAINPLARAVLQGVAAGKHVLLAFDSFHLMRLGFWASIVQQRPTGYKRGLMLLDQTAPEIMRLAQDGEIPRSYLNQIMEDKALVDNVMIKTGYNVGTITDNLYSHLVQKIPITGAFNKWLFGQFQRGAMTSAWLFEFKRVKSENPELSDLEVGRRVSKDLNIRFGSIGSQGWFKSRTFQDLARLTFLAPQWNEGLIKSELGGVKGLAKGIVTGDSSQMGTLGKSVGTALLFSFVANQIINLVTRGHPTTENKEEGMDAKMSAWIPDITGSGSGIMVSSLSLPMETLHLIAKNVERRGTAQDAARQYLQSRLGVFTRPLWTLLTKRDWADRPIKNEDMIKELAKSAIPVPISASAATRLSYEMAKREISNLQGKPYQGGTSQRFPGEYQRQVMSSLGMRNESAPSDEQRILSLANEYKKDHGIESRAEFSASDYAPLTLALRINNKEQAKKELQDLLKKKTEKQIREHYREWPKFPFTSSTKRTENDFYSTLTDEQKRAYDSARDKRRKIRDAAIDLINSISAQ